MPRTVSVSLPSERTDDLLAEVRELQGLITLSVQKGVSLKPRGDLISVEVTDRDLKQLMQVLHRHGAAKDGEVSVSMAEAVGMVSASSGTAIGRDASSSSFEEMDYMIARESNMAIYRLLVMTMSGVVAVGGLASNSLHLVIGAMLVAPGFEPLVRISLGVVTRGPNWRWGLIDTAKGYAALLIGAATMALLLRLTGQPVLEGRGGYLSRGVLIDYWTTFTLTATVVTIAAGLSGALLIAAGRSVLTAGVMVALALVPSAALIGVGMASGDVHLAGMAAIRWVHDAVIVSVTALLVLAPIGLNRGQATT
jgi:uncharacterized membrane protein